MLLHRRRSRSISPRRRKSPSPSPRRRKSRSPTPRRHKRRRTSVSPITKSRSPNSGSIERKNASENLRKEEEEKKRYINALFTFVINSLSCFLSAVCTILEYDMFVSIFVPLLCVIKYLGHTVALMLAFYQNVWKSAGDLLFAWSCTIDNMPTFCIISLFYL